MLLQTRRSDAAPQWGDPPSDGADGAYQNAAFGGDVGGSRTNVAQEQQQQQQPAASSMRRPSIIIGPSLMQPTPVSPESPPDP